MSRGAIHILFNKSVVDNGGKKFIQEWVLELVCCKKRQKIVPDQLMVWGVRAL